MEQTRNGGGKVVAFEEAMMLGRHRNGSLPAYLDTGVARPPQGAASRRRTYGDGELDVFSAERYFKGAMDDGATAVVPRPKLDIAAAATSAATRPVVAVAKPAGTRASAASVTSASSANSRTTLLRRRRDHHRENKKCCVHVGALVRSCSGKRAVRVDDTGVMAANKVGVLSGAGDPSAASIKVDWYKELRMQKAALGVVAGGDGIIANRGVVAATLPPSLNNLGTAKVAAVGREVIPPSEKAPVRANNVTASNGHVSNEHGDDEYDGAGSESSSDLFEIKSLMIDECSYEPSEASIQWSVTTATAPESGGDRGAARWVTGGGHRGRGQIIAGRQSRDRPPSGMLSGCVSHRAVEVSAATTMTAATNAPRRRGESFHHKAWNGA